MGGLWGTMATDGSDFNAYLASDYYFMLVAAALAPTTDLRVLNPDEPWVLFSRITRPKACRPWYLLFIAFATFPHFPQSRGKTSPHPFRPFVRWLVRVPFPKSFACYYYFTLPSFSATFRFYLPFLFCCCSLHHSSIIHIDFFFSGSCTRLNVNGIPSWLPFPSSRLALFFLPSSVGSVNNWQETLSREHCLSRRPSRGVAKSHWSHYAHTQTYIGVLCPRMYGYTVTGARLLQGDCANLCQSTTCI